MRTLATRPLVCTLLINTRATNTLSPCILLTVQSWLLQLRIAEKSTTEQLRRSLCTGRPLPGARARPLRVCLLRWRSTSAQTPAPRSHTRRGSSQPPPAPCPARHGRELRGAALHSGLLLRPKPLSFKVHSQFSLFLAKRNCLKAPNLCSLDRSKFITLSYSYSSKHS